MWDDIKPFEDRPLNRALEHLRKKLPGVGAALPRGDTGAGPGVRIDS